MTETITKPPATRPSWQRSLRYLLQADATAQLRNNRSIFLSFILPIIWLVAFNAGKRGARLGSPEFRTSIAITLGVVTIGVIAYSLAVARDRDNGVFQRLRVSPAPTWTIMVSRFIVQVAAIILMTAVVLIAAAIFENLTLAATSYLLILPVVIIGGVVFLSIGQTIVGLIRSADTLNATGRLLYIPLFALSLFGNTDILGTTIEYISRWSPGGAFESILSGAMQPSTWSGDTWLALLACLGYVVLFAGIGIRWFRWASK